MFIKTVKKVLAGIGIVLLSLAVLVILLAGYLVMTYNQALVLPDPTGPLQVGRIEYDWVDQNRIDPLSDQNNEKRELVIWAWYPVARSEQGSRAPYLPLAWVTARNTDQGTAEFTQSKFSSILTHTLENAAIAKTQSSYPVIIMEPGMGPIPTDYTVFAENLASHGYIVIGINPTYTSNIIVFPDGRIAPRSKKGTIPDNADAASFAQESNDIGKVWTADVLFVMNQLQAVNTDPLSLFHNKFDLAHIGVFGHSFGGATAISVCEIDIRCKAGADLDGTPMSDTLASRIQSPFLFMAEDGCGADCDTMRSMYNGANNAAFYLTVKGEKHFNFSDLPLRLSPLARVLFNKMDVIGTIVPERGLEISNTYLVAFFDRYLKGTNSELLQNPSSVYPEVMFEKR